MAASYFLLLLSIIGGVAGQLLLKYGMRQRVGFQLGDGVKLAKDMWVIGGFGCYGISVLLYFKVLATLDLSLAYPTVSFGYVLVILMSRLLFKESISPIRWLAVGMICAGVVFVGLGAV
jgi:multidrug transporter EmrE-like cation transporter